MSKFQGKVAVITGASGAIGKALAIALLAQGATVCLIGRNLAALKQVPEFSSIEPSRVYLYQADLLVDEDIQALAIAIRSDHHHIDILIHSAGIISINSLERAEVEQFDQQFRINTRAPFLITKLLLETIKNCQGQIVFINSSVVFNSRAEVGQYSATKQALKAIADSLRLEVNVYGVRVLSIYPGRTASSMHEKIFALEGETYDPKRLVQPEDIADTVLSALSLPTTSEITDINIRPLNNWQK